MTHPRNDLKTRMGSVASGRSGVRLSLLSIACVLGCELCSAADDDRIQRVIEGLRPAIVIEGQPAATFGLRERMRAYQVPGVSIAVIDNGEIAWAYGYGVREAGTADPVTAETQFQAASVSKSIAAVVVLRLAERGEVDLDEDVNRRLRTWELPANRNTAKRKVTPRLILSHRAGLTDRAGFRGSGWDDPLPALSEVLETGEWTPAPIRVGAVPDTRFQYSGGGYGVLQLLMEDVSGKRFPSLARELVFDPLEMTSSSFDQAITPERLNRAAVGHGLDGESLPHRWRRFAVTSAAGLWTTPSDLARFLIAVQAAKAGVPGSILARDTVVDMLSVQGAHDERDARAIAMMEAIPETPPPSRGLGVGLIGSPPGRIFHTGMNPGYQCEIQGYVDCGRGAVVMTNGARGWRLVREILWSIAREYEWADYDYVPETRRAVTLSDDELERFVGRYRVSRSQSDEWTLVVVREGGQISARLRDSGNRVRLHPESANSCFILPDGMRLRFVEDDEGVFAKVVSDHGWRGRRVRR